MSIARFVEFPNGDRAMIGSTYFGGTNRGKCFGFAPVRDSDLTKAPGEEGYGSQMLAYWMARVLAFYTIYDEYGSGMLWVEFFTWLTNSHEVTVTNEFVGGVLE